jgi:site-specific recombinase XerD
MARSHKKLRGIYENPSESGIFFIQYFDAAGKRRREKAGRKSDAINLLAKRRTEKLQQRKLPETLRRRLVTFDELADDALEHSRAENGEETSYNLALKISAFRHEFGKRAVEEITKQEIVRFLHEQAEERDWSPGSVNRWQAALSLIFRVGIENGKISLNPAAKIKRKTENRGRVRFLSAEEELVLRKEIAKSYPQHLPALEISIHTGIRAGEQFRIRWSDIDFDRRILTIPKTKNGDTRHIPLNQIALSAFRQLRKDGPRAEWVFVNSEGNQLRNQRDWFDRVLENTKLPNYTWHCNRHTFASRLVMAGVDLRTVGELLGHRTFQMTLRYAHLAADHKESAVDRLCDTAPARQRRTARKHLR